jgi:hypothetical protein
MFKGAEEARQVKTEEEAQAGEEGKMKRVLRKETDFFTREDDNRNDCKEWK